MSDPIQKIEVKKSQCGIYLILEGGSVQRLDIIDGKIALK